MLESVAEDVDGSAFGDLALEAREELASDGGVGVDVEAGGGLRLGRVQEGGDLDEVDAVFSVVVAGVAAGPSGVVVDGAFADCAAWQSVTGGAGECRADEAFESAFGDVGGHWGPWFQSNLT